LTTFHKKRDVKQVKIGKKKSYFIFIFKTFFGHFYSKNTAKNLDS